MDNIELFILKAAATNSQLRQALQDPDVALVRSEVEQVTDKLVASHLEQVDASIRRNAERMSEFYKIFYVLENDIRNLVEETLNDAVGEDWWNSFAGLFANTTIIGVQRVIKKLNLARGPIAHCNLLAEDEVVRLKLTVRD